jgi:hypothetical protein
MSTRDCDIKLPSQNDLTAQCKELIIQYNQLLCLRAELAQLLLSRSKSADYAEKSIGRCGKTK